MRWSSLAVRQALLFSAVSLLLLLGFAFFLIETSAASIRRDLLHTVDTDIAGLVDVLAAGGVEDLQKRIGDRIALDPNVGSAPLYRLSDAGGRRIAGNLDAVPGIDAAASKPGTVQLKGGTVVIRATRLKGGLQLVVGRSLEPVARLTDRLTKAVAWAALAIAVLSVLLGALIAGRLARRVAYLNETFDRFDKGDLSVRAALPPHSDEIASLAMHVDAHLSRIEALFKAQRQISDNIAHELRTPLVHLDARLLRALEREPAPDVAAELERARADVRSVVSLFDALLDIAMAESAGGAGTLTTTIDLSEVASDVSELYAASAEEAGVDFSTRIAPAVMLRGEAMQMARLIANLLDNAFKYAPAGSRVRLAVSAGPRLVVEDNGPGIAPEDRERVFQRFLRSSATGEGHGLGLALVKVIATRHGLTAHVEDANPGARFVIEAEVNR